MNMNKLNRAGESIHLSDEAKKRIIAGCFRKLPDIQEEYSDHIITVKACKHRKYGKTAVIAAACIIVIGGVGLTFHGLSKCSLQDDYSANSSHVTRVNDQEYSGIPLSIGETPIAEFIETDYQNNDSQPWLSDSQHQKINAILNSLTYTEIPPQDFGEDYDYDVVLKYDAIDNFHSIFFKDDIAIWSCHTQIIENGIPIPLHNTKKYYRLSENVYDKLKSITDVHFLHVFDKKFSCIQNGDGQGLEEMKNFLQGLDYKDITGTEEALDLADGGITITCKADSYYHQVNISGNKLIYDIMVDTANGPERLHMRDSADPYYGETYIVADHSDLVNEIYKIWDKASLLSVFNKDFNIERVDLSGRVVYDSFIEGERQDLNTEQRTRIREMLKEIDYTPATEGFPADIDGIDTAVLTCSDNACYYSITIAGGYIKYTQTHHSPVDEGKVVTKYYIASRDDIPEQLINDPVKLSSSVSVK